jgi:shikimate dehydrogenase
VLRGASERFLGVLGWPLRHTLSPVMQNAAFRAAGLEWHYLAFPVPPEELGAAIEGLRSLGAVGANVTMPHKEAVLALLDEVSGDARELGAVNTIQRVGGRLVGHNTDLDGFREFVSGDAGIEVAGRSAVVLGAGGAARAVTVALDDLGAASIVVCARRPRAARAVARLARRARREGAGWDGVDARVTRADVVINSTPLGSQGEDPAPGASFRPGQAVVDLVYHPPATPLVERARAAGADAWGGLGMLVRQGAASFRIWTGRGAPIETMSAAAVRALGHIGNSLPP